MVTITGQDDGELDGDIAYSVVTAAAISNDNGYNGLNAADVAVVNRDNEQPLGDANDMYVWDIKFISRDRGHSHDERISVTVRRDSDADGVAEATDALVTGADVTVVLSGPIGGSFSGVTNSSGVFQTDWIRSVPDGTYVAEVTWLGHASFMWNQDLDPTGNDTDLDGDNLPDQSHTVPHGAAAASLSPLLADDLALAAAISQQQSSVSSTREESATDNVLAETLGWY